MFRVFAHHVRGLIVVEALADTLVCFLAVLGAGKQLIVDHALLKPSFPATEQLLVPAAAFTIVMSLMYSFVGLYRRGAVTVSFRGLFGRTLLALLAGASIAFFALTLAGHRGYAVELLGRAALYVTAGVVVVRSVAFLARRASLGARRVLIVGTGDEAQAVAHGIRSADRSNATIVGYYPAGEVGPNPHGVESFPSSMSITQIVRENRVDEIIVAVREQRGGGVPMGQLLECRIRGIPVLDMAGFNERVYGEVPIDSLKASWLVYGHGFVQGPLRSATKRTFDLVCSLLLLAMAMPVMLAAMVAIRLGSEGPIFYSQERVGRGGRVFKCLKFRSMRTDAEKDGIARWASKNDSRVTRVGAFMRKTRIDELPQLISVLRGEMSLVGPRPERPSFVAELKETIPFYDIRHSVKPGVTGWAQVRFGYCATLDDSRRKHQFDLYYVKNNSLFLDLLVLIETVSVVLFREGSQ